MNRFQKIPKYRRFTGRLLFPLLTFCLVMILFLYGLGTISETTAYEQKRTLETALKRSVIQSYALNGVYPENLDELMSEYAIAYDSDKFLIKYQPIGSNIMPDITVLDNK